MNGGGKKIQKNHLHKCIVWCGFCIGGIIGQFFFDRVNEEAVIFNGEAHKQMIKDFWNKIHNRPNSISYSHPLVCILPRARTYGRTIWVLSISLVPKLSSPSSILK